MRSQFLVFLFCIEALLQASEPCEFTTLHKARLNFLLDRHLSSSVLHLKDASLDQYKELVSNVRNELEQSPDDAGLKLKLSLLLVEQSYC